MEQRVVITGLGAVTPLGTHAGAFWEGLLAGRSGVRTISSFDASGYSTRIAAEVPDFDFFQYNSDRKEARRLARFSQFAIAAAIDAVKDAGLALEALDRDRMGVFIGSGMGALGVIEE